MVTLRLVAGIVAAPAFADVQSLTMAAFEDYTTRWSLSPG
jgi:hypothetical protein